MGYVHLHAHSEYSPLDGLSTVKEMVAAAQADDQPAMAVTDHGVCSAHPDFQLACDEVGIKPIFGLEAYFVPDRHSREGANNDYHHLVLWAMNDEGLKNLWAMSTESYRDGMHYKPRIDWDTLQRLNTGVMASTACLGGPVLKPLTDGNEELALSNLLRLQEIFGDRLYIEIHTTGLDESIKGNFWLLEQAMRYGIEPVAVVDSHYACKDDQHTHQVWLASQINKEVTDDSDLFAGGHDYHIMTEAEVRTALSYLPEEFVELSVSNTIKVAERCTARIEMGQHNPVFSRVTPEHPDPVLHDRERLLDWCLKRWEERTQGKDRPQEEYMARFENEVGMIFDKGFTGYFLMVADLVSYAKRNGVLVGPGRGSGGGSLVAYLLGITEIDPVEHDVLFERFMTKGRTELPDFDIDFPSSKKQFMFDYLARTWGEANIATVGTHMRLKSKSVIQSVARAIKSQLPEDHWIDVMACSDIIEAAEGDTAGLGLSWADLWDRAGEELEPYRARYPELFELAGKLHGRLKSYGKHPAGVIIDPDHPLTENLPLRLGDDGQMIAQFDLKVLELLGYVKFDLLNLRNLDTLQITMDLIKEKTGRVISPYAWRDELHDPYLYEQIGEGHTLGLFQIETATGTNMCRRMKPTGLHELADLVTLVRPGPARSGLTDIYLARRKGELEISYADPRMESVLGQTWGAMIYQEQLMKLCMVLAGYDDVEADKVRKILGKKKVEDAKKQGSIFIERAMANRTDEMVTRELWAQMEEFARYSFGYAHALAYAILAIWTAYFKFHFPLFFLCAALSTVKDEMLPVFVEEARRMGYQVLPPDINLSGKGFSLGDTGLDIRYGLDAVKGVGPAAVEAITQGQPYTSWEDFLERKGAACNAGVIKTLVHIGAFDSLVPNRRWLEKVLEHEAIPGTEKCEHRTGDERAIVWLPSPVKGVPSEPETLDWTLPCAYDWQAEPDTEGRTGKKQKRKAPPKRCTRACRQYTPTEPPEPGSVAAYTPEQVRTIEQDLLGVYLSSTPFDIIPEEDRDQFATADDVLSGPHGTYMIAAVIQGFRTAKNRDDMGFLSLATPKGQLSTVVFPSMYERHGAQFHKGTLIYASVAKNDRGQSLEIFVPIR